LPSGFIFVVAAQPFAIAATAASGAAVDLKLAWHAAHAASCFVAARFEARSPGGESGLDELDEGAAVTPVVAGGAGGGVVSVAVGTGVAAAVAEVTGGTAGGGCASPPQAEGPSASDAHATTAGKSQEVRIAPDEKRERPAWQARG
jgi:hypothetical protein